eukprot:6463958-Amphidinium_carterae.1
MEISSRLELSSYVAWGRELAKLQFGEELSAVKQSYEAALQAATFLAQERETWMRSGQCSREEAADAYLAVNLAFERAAKPNGQLRALQRSIQLFPNMQCGQRGCTAWGTPMAILVITGSSATAWRRR